MLQEKTFLLQFTQVDQRNIFSSLTLDQHLDSLTKLTFLLTFRLVNQETYWRGLTPIYFDKNKILEHRQYKTHNQSRKIDLLFDLKVSSKD